MSYATAALATYANSLSTLDHLVTKAESHETGEALLQARLAEDMFPLHPDPLHHRSGDDGAETARKD